MAFSAVYFTDPMQLVMLKGKQPNRLGNLVSCLVDCELGKILTKKNKEKIFKKYTSCILNVHREDPSSWTINSG